MTITIYSKNNCVYCTKAKALLKGLGLSFETRRMEEFESVLQLLNFEQRDMTFFVDGMLMVEYITTKLLIKKIQEKVFKS